MKQVMLTTIDNPYDPFTNYREWSAYDMQQGYNTPDYLARVALTSDELSEADYNAEVEKAIDEIVELNITGVYKKVVRFNE